MGGACNQIEHILIREAQPAHRFRTLECCGTDTLPSVLSRTNDARVEVAGELLGCETDRSEIFPQVIRPSVREVEDHGHRIRRGENHPVVQLDIDERVQ